MGLGGQSGFLRSVAYFFLFSLLFIVLTLITQIGGLILLLGLWLNKITPKRFIASTPVIFLVLYLIATFLIVPLVAPIFGRQRVDTSSQIKPATYLTIFLNRSYVTPELNAVLQELSLNNSIRFLDAGFPFIDGFPLLPHLSHNDGKKIDLGLKYRTPTGQKTDQVKSRTGYGAFVEPMVGESDQPAICKKSGYFQYSYPKYFSLGIHNPDLEFSAIDTKQLLIEIVHHEDVEKVFLEPHLVTRLNLDHGKIRYHGCHAVRHDDHIHLQVK